MADGMSIQGVRVRANADDVAQFFGTGNTVKILYETADANANALIFVAPEGGATDVPVFIFGDASIDNVDLGFFNGITEPTIAIVNDAADAYASLDAGDDAVAGSKGLYFKSAADEDVELLNMSLTGTPRIYWDESEDQFRSTKGWVFDAACDVQGTWVATAAWTLPAITLGGAVTGGAQVLSNLGQIYIGDTANAKQTLGLTVNQGAADDEALSLKSSDVAHGYTDQTETDTFGDFKKVHATDGGLIVEGQRANATVSLQLTGVAGANVDTTKSTAGVGITTLYAAQHSAGAVANVVADGNLIAMRGYAASAWVTRFLFDIEGSGHADVEWALYDRYDDLAVLKDMEQELLLREDEAKTERRHLLEDIGIIGKGSWHMENDKPRAMVNFTKLAMLQHGALMQLGAKVQQQAEEILALKQQFLLS